MAVAVSRNAATRLAPGNRKRTCRPKDDPAPHALRVSRSMTTRFHQDRRRVVSQKGTGVRRVSHAEPGAVEVTALMIVVSAAASIAPARRALSVHPTEALRAE